MAEAHSSEHSASTEKTFTSYNSAQGKAYAAARRDYHPSVYKTIVEHHGSTGGGFDTLVDIGCGPGLAVRALAPHFQHAFGLDPSPAMLDTARTLGGSTSVSAPIHYEVSGAEQLGDNLNPPIEDASVDLIVSANAAHWFDMPSFWASAARVLKPGGTVALWASGEIRADTTMPNAEAIQAAMDKNRELLFPYYEAGNYITRNSYTTLPLPWSVEPPVKEFDEKSFFRKQFGQNEPIFTGVPEVDLDTWEKMAATGSPETRWRQAHPDLAGTEDDVITLLRRDFERILHEAGVPKGEERLRGVAHGALLIIKKVQS